MLLADELASGKQFGSEAAFQEVLQLLIGHPQPHVPGFQQHRLFVDQLLCRARHQHRQELVRHVAAKLLLAQPVGHIGNVAGRDFFVAHPRHHAALVDGATIVERRRQ